MFDFFDTIDIISFIGWLVIFIIIAHLIYVNNKQNPEFRFFLTHFYWKILMGLAFGLVYILYYDRHGDTVFYWQGAKKLNLLFLDNPKAYLHEIFSTPPRDYVPNYFSRIGTPPVWIYSEPNSWFVCKVANFLSFFSFGSYLTLNLFFSVISTCISWRFFRYMNKILLTKTNYIALSCLFIPSVAFWCSGLIKDTIAISAIFVLTISILKLIRKDYNSLTFVVINLLLSFYFLYSIRPFLVICTAIPFLIVLIFKVNKDKPFVVKFLTRILGISLTAGSLLFYFSNTSSFGEFSAGSVFETAEVIQKDMLNNAGYTGKRYHLSIEEFSGTNLLLVAPEAIATTLFRPFVWEADSAFMLLNGLENLFILYLCIRFFLIRKKNPLNNDLKDNFFYLYALFLVLILAYFVGLTSGLFGTLVRLKTPVMPFFLLIILYKWTDPKKVPLKQFSDEKKQGTENGLTKKLEH